VGITGGAGWLKDILEPELLYAFRARNLGAISPVLVQPGLGSIFFFAIPACVISTPFPTAYKCFFAPISHYPI